MSENKIDNDIDNEMRAVLIYCKATRCNRAAAALNIKLIK